MDFDDIQVAAAVPEYLSVPRSFNEKRISDNSDFETEKVETVRSFFPETWLWDILKLGCVIVILLMYFVGRYI